MSDNLIEIVNSDILVQIEDVSNEITVNDLIVFDYAYSQNKPKINSVELVGNKSLGELGIAAAADLSSKENVSNKVTSLSNLSTNEQYPSAKVVYDGLLEKADIDFSNLSQTGLDIINSKADIDLSNLSLTGQSVINAKANLDLSNTTAALSSGFMTKMMPDYSSGISMGLGTTIDATKTFTAPSAGEVNIRLRKNSTYGLVTIEINGDDVFSTSGANSATDNMFNFPVASGDIIRIYADSLGQSFEVMTNQFFPLRGV